MKTIYKYPLSEAVQMPKGAKILTAQDQGGQIFIWAEVDSHARTDKTREFLIIGTGQELPNLDNWQYVATVQQGIFVWHIYAEINL